MNIAVDLLAVDVGTSRVKLGFFPAHVACETKPAASLLPITAGQLPEPAETFACRHREVPLDELTAQLTGWLSQFDGSRTQVALASVSPEMASFVVKLCSQLGFPEVREIVGSHLPLSVQVKKPGRVGIDRLLNAVAVNRIRSAGQPAIVMDLGTAVTVDLVGPQGEFLGGAILPGWALSAKALHGGTSSLPLLTSEDMPLPASGLGKCTTEAIAAGITWGLVGALENLVKKYADLTDARPQLFITGGDAPLILDALNESLRAVRHVSHLVLAGIAIACEERP